MLETLDTILTLVTVNLIVSCVIGILAYKSIKKYDPQNQRQKIEKEIKRVEGLSTALFDKLNQLQKEGISWYKSGIKEVIIDGKREKRSRLEIMEMNNNGLVEKFENKPPEVRLEIVKDWYKYLRILERLEKITNPLGLIILDKDSQRMEKNWLIYQLEDLEDRFEVNSTHYYY